MLWFIAIMATVNLCLGFALGANYGWSVLGLEGISLPSVSLPGLSFLKRKEKTGSDDAQAEALEAGLTEELAPEAPPGGTAADAAAPDGRADGDKPKPTTADVMEGLAAFQAQLAGLSQELGETEEDQAFDDCAERMQQANHEYLDHAQDAVNQLEGDEEAAPVCDAVKAGAEEVQRVSDEFDATMANDDQDAAAREKLRELSDQLVESVKSVETKVHLAAHESAEGDAADDGLLAKLLPLEIDPATSLATIDSLTARVEALLEEDEPGPPLVIATVQADSSEEEPLPVDLLPALLPKLGEAVAEAAGPIGPPALFNGDQLLVALPGDSVDEASRRIEQVRQQVEATKFVEGGSEREITVSCGMAQSAPGVTLENLQELLAEALGEAHRYGGNRACHHDGKFPAPVMPEDFEPEPRTVTL